MTTASPPSVGRARLTWYKPMLLCGLALLLCVGLNAKIYEIRGKYVQERVSEVGQLPSSVLQAVTLEFKGAFSDYLFFKTLTFMGLKIAEKKGPSVDEWQLIHQMLQRVTDLDPRFWDPYVFAEMMLAWQARMFDEANALLEKAAEYRPHDYRPLYYIGFNHFYFHKNMKAAAPYLIEASKRPRAPRYLKGLATRMSFYAGQTSVGIFFLENLIKETHDPQMVKYLGKRLTALKMLFYLEGKVQEFKTQHGQLPESLDELVTTGLIKQVPIDPYGGKFVVLKSGRVYTTSEMLDK